EACFVLAGEGNLTKGLKLMSQDLGISANSFFIGRCDHVADLLHISDICVLSSKAEGFSNSILEYMAAERPVVATAVGGASEAIVEGVTGYLVESGDDEAMANRILSLLKDPNRARSMGIRGRERVQEKFSDKAQLENTQAMYDQLLEEASRL
ncbi:MAG TPA: glycosyltransferase, partial [Pyrinomonadaceae bacterium]